MKVHKLKTWPIYFEAVQRREKTAELRLNDRDFQVGDFLYLLEYDQLTSYSGKFISVQITHIIQGINHLKENHIMLRFKIITEGFNGDLKDYEETFWPSY